MTQNIPKSKWQRGLSGSKTAAKMSRKALTYLVRKPFLKEEEKKAEKKALNRENAAVLFEGLSLLKGTALKIAQMLSMEMEIFPPELTKELQKSYHQVPPINRALVRKIVHSALGEAPEEVFTTFESTAFAAASLGQVHRASTREGIQLAVKIQYPGIRETIHNDVQMLRTLWRAMPDYRTVLPAILEIETRLLEETDYHLELQNMTFFGTQLRMDRIAVPKPFERFSTETVLTAQYMEGMTLNQWLKTNPDLKKSAKVAQTLQDLFIFGLYRMKRIHADPNPGNFLISPDGRIGLVDFGCVKRFDPHFVDLYGELPRTALCGDKNDYVRLLRALKLAGPSLNPEILDRMYRIFHEIGQWLGKLYQDEYFDFKKHPDFIVAGKKLMHQAFELRRHADLNTNFIFLHRTRYGLLRLFEQMGARVCFRNPYEHF